MTRRHALMIIGISVTVALIALSVLISPVRQVVAPFIGISLVVGVLYGAAKIIGIGINDTQSH